jgi:hypothetical protein
VFHRSILFCLWWTVSFGTTYRLLSLMWRTIISLLTAYLPL